MAYVVARPAGRFEIRESLHTPRGPRARSLANFGLLTDRVLAVAAGRATRPFDGEAVVASASRLGVPMAPRKSEASNQAVGDGSADPDDSRRRFVESSRRMVDVLERPPHEMRRRDPGSVLIDLLGFADAAVSSQPPRPFEPLAFPVLSRLTGPPPSGTNSS